MPLFRIAAAVAFAALAAEPRGAAVPHDRDTVRVGPVLGDPERESVGLPRGAHEDCARVPFSPRDAMPQGPGTGGPEKDESGSRTAGWYDSCAGTIR